MEGAVARIRRLFPTATVEYTNGGVKVSKNGRVCWIDADEVAALTDDMDVSHLVTALLYGLL